jgi:hypothetical protein
VRATHLPGASRVFVPDVAAAAELALQRTASSVARAALFAGALAGQPPRPAVRAGGRQHCLQPHGTPVCAAVGCVSARRRPAFRLRRAPSAPGCRSASAGLPGIVRESWGSAPNTPRRGALRVRRVTHRALQPGTACAWLRRAPVAEFGPPPTPRRRRPRLQPQNPRGFRTLRAAPALPLPPRGRPEGRQPQPGQAESQCSRGVGLCGQGHAQRSAPGGASASLDRAHPAAGPAPAAWPENGLGQGAGRPHRWRSRWSRAAPCCCG